MPDAASQYGLILIALAYAVIELIKAYSLRMANEAARVAREDIARTQEQTADEQNEKLNEQKRVVEATHLIVNSQRAAMEAAIERLTAQVLDLSRDKARIEGEQQMARALPPVAAPIVVDPTIVPAPDKKEKK